MLRKALFTALFVVIIVIPNNAMAAVPINFGGRVAVSFPCVNGVLFTVIEPKPISPVGIYMLATFVHTRSNFTTPFPGQVVLGKALTVPYPCLIPCPIGVCPIAAAPLVIYSGSNL